jgi:hypothetical protein
MRTARRHPEDTIGKPHEEYVFAAYLFEAGTGYCISRCRIAAVMTLLSH